MSRLIVLMILLIGLTGSLFSGVPDDYSQSCSEGDTHGCYQLAIAYRDGNGVRQDVAASKEFFKIACDMGDTQACDALNDKSVSRPEQSRAERKAVEERKGHQTHYNNERFGFTLSYPAKLFLTKILSDNGDGITLYNGDRSLELRAYGSWYGDNIKQIYRDEQGWAKESGQKVTYKVLKKNWFVLSGIDRKKQTIFYKKTYFRDGKSTSFRLEYPISDKAKYNSLVSMINKNFRAR